jgi:hypothetical protein
MKIGFLRFRRSSLIFPVVLFLFLFSQIVFSQGKQDSTAKPVNNAGYIAKMDTVISVRLNVNNEHERFLLLGSDFKYDIRPNIFFSNRISFNYRFISLGVGFTLRFLPGNNGNELQGKTKAFFLRLNINTKYWLQELQFGRIIGFYLYNTGDYIEGWNKGTDPNIQFPDLRVINVRGVTSYKFNQKFSVKALNAQTEIQLKSCGSLIPSLAYSFYLVDNKSSDTAQKSSQKSNIYEAVINLGYYYTFVISKRFYLSLGVAPGCGASYTHLLTRLPEGDTYTDYFSPVFRMQERAGIGYNSRKFFAGFDISMVQSKRDDNTTAVQLNMTRTYFQVFIGYRFVAPRFIKKNTLLIEDKIPVVKTK